MYQAFDFFERHEIPQIWLCNPDQSRIGNLKAAYSIKPTLRFNEMSELSFTFPEHIENNGTYLKLDAYDLIESKRLVYIEELGYFLIHGITENDDGITKVKNVQAYSLEAELNFKKINLISGTYQFWNPVDPGSSLLGKTFESISSWTIEHVDVELWDLWRTFEVPDATVYNFLMENVEKAYECVFMFDTINKTVSAYTLQNAITPTDVYMSFDTLMEQVEIEELSDEIVTALKVYGDSELDISGVNPLGTPTIYNFDYYKNTEWMSQSLIDAINAWEQKIEDNTEPYVNALSAIKTANTKLYVKSGTSESDEYTTTIGDGVHSSFTVIHSLGTTCPSVLVRDLSTSGEIEPSDYTIIFSVNTPLSFTISFNSVPPIDSIEVIVRNTGLYVVQTSTQEDYDSLMQVKAARIDAGMDFTDINEKLNSINSQLSVINSAIQTQTNILDTNNLILQNINQALSMSNCFTEAQLVELDPFIIENTYQNTAFIKTESMTLIEVQEMQEQLLQQGQTILSKVSTPRYTFAVDCANFLFLKEFQQFAQQLVLGSIMYIRVSESLVATPILLELEYCFDNPDDFKLTFGNRYRLDDSAYVFSDLFSEAISSGVSSSFNQELWQKFVSSGADVALNTLLTEAWDAAKNEIINASNQQIVIDGAGLRGKMQNNDGSYDPQQVWLTGKTLAFTDDNWDSVKLALGEITLNNTKYYGLAAEAVVGQLIAGSNLQIANTSNSFVVDGNGVTITSGNFVLMNDDLLGRMIYNPEDGFKLQTRASTTSTTWQDVLSVNDGTLKMIGNGEFSGTLKAATGEFSGKVTASSGSIGGWQINNPVLQSSNGQIVLNPNGDIDLNKFHITPSGVWNGTDRNTGLDWFIENQNGDMNIYGENGIIVETNGDSIQFASNGYSMLFNAQPVAVGAVPVGVNASNSILEIRTGYVDLTSSEFYNIYFNPYFKVAPMIVGTAIYKDGYGTNINNSLSGAVSVKFSNITTSGCVTTIGAGSGRTWNEIISYFKQIHWVAIGFKAA